MRKRLLVTLIPAVACLAFAAPALATTPEAASENWAGYVATPNDASGFSAASGQWTQPRVDCAANSQPTYSAYWVGLGGGGEQSQALEQIGTQADCGATGKATYYAWYELVPSAPVKLSLAIHPGDRIWARTAVSGDRVSLFITDQATHRTWSRTLTMTAATPDTGTAEWVAEAPSECVGGATGDCTPLTLANFGTATFSDAYATAGGHTGSISDSHWTAEAVALEPSSASMFGGGEGGYFQGGDSGYSSYTSAAAGAAPSSLGENGTRFQVRYGGALQTQSPGSGEAQTSTNPYGYAGGGYAGDGYSGYGGYGYGGGYGYSGYGYGGGYGGGYGADAYGAYSGGWSY